MGLPGLHTPRGERGRATPQYGTRVSQLPEGLVPRYRGARARTTPHSTTADTLPLHPRRDHDTPQGGASESSTGGLTLTYLSLFAWAPGKYRSAGGRSHPLTKCAGQTRSRSAAMTHPGDAVPYITHC